VAPSRTILCYPIECGVPIPAKKARGGTSGKRRFNWTEMGIGDSFFVPFEDYGLTGLAKVSNAVNSRMVYGDVRRYCVRSRNVDEDGEYGWRVWRIT
jgi:hypothetical protein